MENHDKKSLEKTVLLLYQNAWVYDFKLTRFFQDRIWESVPVEWSDCLQTMNIEQLSALPFGECVPSWTPTLNNFIQDCVSLSIPRNLDGGHLWPSELGSHPSQIAHLSGQETSLCRNPDTGAKLVNKISEHEPACREQSQTKTESEQISGTEDLKRDLKVSRNIHTRNSDKVQAGQETLGKTGQNYETGHFPVKAVNAVDKFHRLEPPEIAGEIRKGMSEKKLHEVCQMSSLIDHVTKRSKCNAVVDVGSGLGYLGQVLHAKFGHPVLGLEGKQCHTSGAERRAVKNSSCPFLHNVTCELHPTEESNQELSFLIKDWFNSLSSESGLCCHQTDPACIMSVDSPTFSSHPVGHVSKEIHTLERTGSSDCAEIHLNKKLDTTEPCLQAPNVVFTDSDTKEILKKEYNSCQTEQLTSTDVEKVNEDMGYNCSAVQTRETGFQNLDPKVCMVGLHCCGDLTPTMLKCFRDLDCIRSLCCISCCYHRMKFNECSRNFDHFPMSSCVSDIIERLASSSGHCWNPGLYGMRLAAQETRARWKAQTTEDHNFHMRNVAYRGLLEVCLEKGKFALKKTGRKLAHEKDFKDFTTYVDCLSKHIQIPDREESSIYLQQFHEGMRDLYQEYQHYFSYIEPITALQVLTQPVIESLIYQDRRLWLLENGIHSEIIPIFDEFISPRNLALIAIK